MTPESTYLLRLSKIVALPYTQLPTVKAVMVTGSAAKGLSDRYSDIDMTMYYEESLPDDDALNPIRDGLGGSERRWLLGDRNSGSFAEAYELHGIEVQIGHTTIASWEKTIALVQEELDVESSAQKALEGTLNCKALYGDAYINQWKERISSYPAALGEAMVKKNLQFFAIWGLEPHFSTRDATIWYHEILVEIAQRLVAVLAGLNRLYFTTFQFKRQRRFIEQMAIKPEHFADRLEGLFSAELHSTLTEIEALVSETIALVEIHMPTIDTSTAKRRLGWRHQPWKKVT